MLYINVYTYTMLLVVNRSVMAGSLWPLWTVKTVRFLCPGVSQARILKWVAISYSRGSSWPRDQTLVYCIAGRFFTVWATREGRWYFIAFICIPLTTGGLPSLGSHRVGHDWSDLAAAADYWRGWAYYRIFIEQSSFTCVNYLFISFANFLVNCFSFVFIAS